MKKWHGTCESATRAGVNSGLTLYQHYLHTAVHNIAVQLYCKQKFMDELHSISNTVYMKGKIICYQLEFGNNLLMFPLNAPVIIRAKVK